MMKRAWEFLRDYFALIIVVATYLGALVTVASRRAEEAPPGTITLRIGHWQLEPGVRDGINEMAADYQKLHPSVRIVQDAIPETTYGQWVTTQLIGNTAPDLLEVGLGLPAQVWVTYYNRYFFPLTEIVGQPNPYNKGTDLADVPLRNTYKDGLRAAYTEELQEYMNIPLSQHALRMFYNRDLLKKLTGRTEAPKDYRDFLAVCEQIAAQKNEAGQAYVPLASSLYHFRGIIEKALINPITFDAIGLADLNRDMRVSKDEMFVAFKAGLISFASAPVTAKFRMVREVNQFFQAGYTGLQRDDGILLFIQERSPFISTGTWDAKALVEITEGKFEVGIIDFPLPRKDDPVYGPLVRGPRVDPNTNGLGFGITRTSRHPEVAQDFLLFMASRTQDEKLTKMINWIPAIIGSELSPFLKQFEPNLVGIPDHGFQEDALGIGGETLIKWQQLYALYQVGQLPYEELAAQFEAFYKGRGMLEYDEFIREARRGNIRWEQVLTSLRAKAMNSGVAVSENRWRKYRTVTKSKQIGVEISRQRQRALITEGPAGAPLAPYAFRPAALKRIVENAKGTAATPAPPPTAPP